MAAGGVRHEFQNLPPRDIDIDRRILAAQYGRVAECIITGIISVINSNGTVLRKVIQHLAVNNLSYTAFRVLHISRFNAVQGGTEFRNRLMLGYIVFRSVFIFSLSGTVPKTHILFPQSYRSRTCRQTFCNFHSAFQIVFGSCISIAFIKQFVCQCIQSLTDKVFIGRFFRIRIQAAIIRHHADKRTVFCFCNNGIPADHHLWRVSCVVIYENSMPAIIIYRNGFVIFLINHSGMSRIVSAFQRH